ncbi:MAG: hypothetical protein COB56_06375 [Robiginitomaculum sp.]|nr:MAG: hypothetical protein COB56_06375 [Robiginitomaculum sp.]
MTNKKTKKPTRKHVSSGSEWEEKFAYSRAVAQGDWCFVSGTTGTNYELSTMPEEAAQQTRNAFTTIDAALRGAGFEMGHVVRVQYTVTDRKYIEQIQPELQRAFGAIKPAATLIIANLIEEGMKIEIEVTAYKG